MRNRGVASLFTVVLLSCAPAENAPAGSSAELHAFFERFTAEWIRGNPDQAVSARYFEGEEQAALDREITPRTREWDEARIAVARSGLAELGAFDPNDFSEADLVSAEVMRSQLDVLVEGEDHLDFAFPLHQFRGANVSLVSTLTISHPMATAQDAESYVARLGQVDDRMREAIAESEYQAELGILPPRFIVQATISQMQQFMSTRPADNPLASTLASKMRDVAGLTPEARGRLSAEAAGIVETEVYPAWREAIAVLEGQLSAATDEAGLSRLPGGAEAYAYFLQLYTTTDLTADEIHEIGLREVARIEGEMDVLFRQVGLSEGSIQERVATLRARLAYPDSDEGRRALMADLDDMLADALVRSAASFDEMPRARVIAQPFPEFLWSSAAASYTRPPPDGSRPGIFQMPLRAGQLTRFGKRSLVYHETVPGHHFQLALAVEDEALPAFRQLTALGGIAAITEGWGLYAERLAIEEGWYEGDVEGLIGALDSQLFRARRLVVDTGLHSKGWTRQQAIDYGIGASEVERYVVYPGQACSYMIGQLKLVELRERARTALGERFSLREYHNLVLGLGAVPLDVLERAVDRYIAESN